jgi:COMPASS component SPP1
MAPSTRSSSKAANPPLPSEASPSKPAAAPKGRKKGTANPVKAPKRGAGKSGPASKKRKAAAAAKKKNARPATADGGSVTGGPEDDDDEDEADGGDEDEESDSGPYCICRGPDNHRFMIACERCEDWFHGECIGMDKYTGENLVQQYICPNCTDGKLHVTRYKKTCAYGGCRRPARMYGEVIERAEEGSKFCSDEHCQAWWEQLIATLPKKKQGGADALTQGEFMGLLGNPPNAKAEAESGWKLGDEPFGMSTRYPPWE